MLQLIEVGYLPVEIIPARASDKARLNSGAKLQVIPHETLRVGTHPETGEINGYVQVIDNQVVAAWTPEEIAWVTADPFLIQEEQVDYKYVDGEYIPTGDYHVTYRKISAS